MLPHSLWWLAVDALAVYRLTMLTVKDTITAPFRRALGKPFLLPPGEERIPAPMHGLRWWTFELVTCPWCLSIWLGAGAVALTRFWPAGWQYAALALALSGVTGFLAER